METETQTEEFTTIQISKHIYNQLVKRKIHIRQSFNEVLGDMIRELKESNI